jgi:hypothetical protein
VVIGANLVADTSVVCTVAAGSTSCTSGAATAAIAAGDLVVFRSDAAADLPADVNVYFGWTCS